MKFIFSVLVFVFYCSSVGAQLLNEPSKSLTKPKEQAIKKNSHLIQYSGDINTIFTESVEWITSIFGEEGLQVDESNLRISASGKYCHVHSHYHLTFFESLKEAIGASKGAKVDHSSQNEYEIILEINSEQKNISMSFNADKNTNTKFFADAHDVLRASFIGSVLGDPAFIIDASFEKTGGLSFWRKVNKIISTYSLPDNNISTVERGYPNSKFETRQRVTQSEGVRSVSGFTSLKVMGDAGYTMASGKKVDLSGEELKWQLNDSYFLELLYFPFHDMKMEYKGFLLNERGDVLHKILRTDKNGIVGYFYFNAESKLLDKVEYPDNNQTILLDNYKKVLECKVPFKVTKIQDGKATRAILEEFKYFFGSIDVDSVKMLRPQSIANKDVAQLKQAEISKSKKKLALIIGNGGYSNGGSLKNPVNDVRSMSIALKSLGFEVIKVENGDLKSMKASISEFGSRLRDYEVGLFYYAGHGVQSKGSNYMIPVEANLKNEQQVELDCIPADRVLAHMEAAGSSVNILILDACRNNPFERSWRRSTEGSGLAFMNAPSGTIIAYATSPGRTAEDGIGENGLYTQYLLKHMKTPGLTIEQMFKKVRVEVEDKSGKKQTPWESTSLKGDFYFRETSK